MNSNISIGEFISVHIKILKELFKLKPVVSMLIIIFSLTISAAIFLELFLLQTAVNGVSDFINGIDNWSYLSRDITFLLAGLLVIVVLRGVYGVIQAKYLSKVSFDAGVKVVKKLSKISYENYENSVHYDKIKLANDASYQYADALFGIIQLIQIIVMLAVYSVILSEVSVVFIIITFAAIIISSLFAAFVTHKQLDFYVSKVSPEYRSKNYFQNILFNRANQATVQTHRSVSFFTRKFGDYTNSERKNLLKLNLLSFSTEIMSSLFFAGAFFVTALVIAEGVITSQFEINVVNLTD